MAVIFVDMREGSAALLPALRKMGLPAEAADPQLDAGDLFFVGRGEKGTPVSIGVEFKTVADVVSSLRTERLQGHQLIGMRGADPGQAPLYDFAYLLVEGDLNYDGHGKLLRRAGRQSFKPVAGGMTISELFKRLNVLHLRGGLNWAWFRTRADVVQWIAALYHTWTDVDLDQHKSHLAVYTPPALVPVSQFRRTVGTLPGVGTRVSKAAEQRFGTIKTAINAGVDEWAGIEVVSDKGGVRRLGIPTAIRIAEAIE